MARKTYALTSGDRAIFEASRKDPNIFLNYYLKSPTSGTYWLPGSKTTRWKNGYNARLKLWKKLGRPDGFEYAGKLYEVQLDHEFSEKYPDFPCFFHNHGYMMLDWAKDLALDRTQFRTLIGGWGSGKTLNMALMLLFYAATLPGFRGFSLGPTYKQVDEMFNLCLQLMRGTEYERRFKWSSPSSPVRKIVIANDFIMESTIEFYSLHDDPDALLTLTGDCAIIDQTEKIDDIEGVIQAVGSRFRGRAIGTGRSRVGTITFIANSAENVQLWDLFDMADEDPAHYKSLQPSSYDNIYLTDADFERLEVITAGSDELKQQKIFGSRPLGNGEHFSRQTLELIREPHLDRIMETGLAKGLPGFVHQRAPKVGTYEWLLPPLPGRHYLVMSDPGTTNPPHRDSPPILVFDITDFPGTIDDPKPALLVGFKWVYGNGDIQNWADAHAEMVHRYKAYNSHGFDGTGFQKGYDEWFSILQKLMPEPINLGGNGKWECINAAKMLTTADMVKLPAAVDSLFSQLSRYQYPEGRKDRQDIAVAFFMAMWWLQRLYFFRIEDEKSQEDVMYVRDRHARYLPERTRR